MHIREKELIMQRAALHARREEFEEALSCIQMIIDEDPDDPVAWFNKGYTLYLSGSVDDARDLFLHLLSKYPDRADICFELGRIAQKTGDNQEALEYFSRCISLEPLRPEPRIELGKMWYESGHYHTARDTLSEALVFDPENPEILTLLGRIAHKLNKPDEAERWFRESLDHDPDDTETLLYCARLYEEMGRLKDELWCYNRLIEINPEQIVPWLKKGMISLSQDNLQMAVSCFRMASGLDADSHLPHLLLGLVYSTLDRHQEAVSSLEKAVSLSDEPDILFHYGRVLGACNQYEKALSVFSSLLIQRPWDSGAAEGYARSLYHLQRWDELIELCEKQRAYNPDNPFWVTTLARVWGWHMSDINKAVQILQEWTGRPAGTEIQLVLADLYVYAERYEEARDLLFSLLKVHPEDYQILFRYASLLAQIREFTCAAEQFEILLQMRSNDGNLSYLAGQSYEQAGDPDRALELFTSAITCIPDNAEIWLSRARVLFELGQYSEAAINAAQAASLNPDWSDAFLLKGLAEIYMEEYDKARISLTCVTTLDPDNPEGWRYLGDAFLHSGEEYAARICYERTLVLDPDDIQAQYGYKTCTDILAARSVTDQSEEPISNEHQ